MFRVGPIWLRRDEPVFRGSWAYSFLQHKYKTPRSCLHPFDKLLETGTSHPHSFAPVVLYGRRTFTHFSPTSIFSDRRHRSIFTSSRKATLATMKSTTALLAATLSSLTLLATTSPVPAPSPQLSLGGTQNGVTSGTAACKPVTLIFARGTFELSNMGSVVGPSLASDLGKAIGSGGTDELAVQGVNYAADVAGIFAEIAGGAGTAAMLAEAKQALSKCPQTKLVLSGYSQGAMLVHNTVGKMQAAEKERVVAAVTFGDPFKSVKLDGVAAERFKTFCATVSFLFFFFFLPSLLPRPRFLFYVMSENADDCFFPPRAIRFADLVVSVPLRAWCLRAEISRAAC